MAEVLKDKGYVFGLINLYPDPMKSSSVEGGFQGLLKKIVENVDELEAETLMYFMLRDPSKTRYCLLESYRNDDALNVHLTAEHNSQLFQELQSCFSQTPSGAMYNGMISGLSPDDKSHLGGVIWITSYDVKSGSEGEFQTICQELVQAYLQKGIYALVLYLLLISGKFLMRECMQIQP